MKPSHPVFLSLAAAAIGASESRAQQPLLTLSQHEYSRTAGPSMLFWNIQGRPGDAAILFADLAPGRTNAFGVDFDLAGSPALTVLWTGTNASFGFPFNPAVLPANVPIFVQAALWTSSQGLGTLLASNVESAAAHDGLAAQEFAFFLPELSVTGRYDHSVYTRLQALPPSIHRVRPIPAGALPVPSPAGVVNPLHPSGARHQMALRALELQADGSPMQLTAVRWRPLFGQVVAETFPQFEVRMSHSDIVPDYTIDPITALPVNPQSGLDPAFANNPRAGTAPVSIYNGPYAIQPAALRPNGYLPFPAPQQPFLYDGASTLLLETLCSPQPGLGAPRNLMVLQQLVQSSAQPFATVAATAGFNGQPSPLNPQSTASGTGGAYLFDVELEFVRTHSVAITQFSAPSAFRDWQPAITCGFTPPGTSIQLEFRGRNGAALTAWSPSPDIADGMDIQVKVTMVADAATGAVPWLDTLIVPAR